MSLKRISSSTILILLFTITLNAQRDSSYVAPPYKVHLKYEVPAAILGIGLTQFGYSQLSAELSVADALALNKNNVNRFDRPVLDFPASGYENAQHISDYVMYSSFALPALLFFDKNVRRDWKEFTTMYFEAHALSSAVYLSSTFPVRRARPLAYNSNYPIELRSGENTNNSFFSGHVNSTAAATFFMASVYNDYHDLTLGQKIALYVGASIPPAIVAQYRMRAGKHFRTDVITGFGLGAATGVLIPALHKRKKNSKLSYVPIVNENMLGLYVRYGF